MAPGSSRGQFALLSGGLLNVLLGGGPGKMNVMPEWNVVGDREADVPELSGSAATAVFEEPPETEEPAPAVPAPADSAASRSSAADGEVLAGIAASVRDLADSAGRYHARAEQRENVIDHLRA